jgi:predicted negative regulator of RcsB-dependent stress response
MDYMKLIENNLKTIAIVLVAFVVGGAAVAFISNSAKTKEKSAQESYYLVEKNFYELKAKKDAPPNPTAKTEPVDFSKSKLDFEKIIVDYPKSIAAQMSALNLASILIEENKSTEALTVLKNVETKSSSLVSYLVQQQIGLVLADQDKCQDAIDTWEKVIKSSEASFLHDELQLQQALCYSKLNNSQKAEAILINLSNKTTNPEMGNATTSKEAEKYLRLLQFKKASGT